MYIYMYICIYVCLHIYTYCFCNMHIARLESCSVTSCLWLLGMSHTMWHALISHSMIPTSRSLPPSLSPPLPLICSVFRTLSSLPEDLSSVSSHTYSRACIPCIPTVLGGLAVWWHITKQKPRNRLYESKARRGDGTGSYTARPYESCKNI